MTRYAVIISLFILTSCATQKSVSNADRDGSSFKKAVIVNSISEEYKYVRSACKGCQVKGQALSYYKKKPFDILTLTTPDGNEVSYYFDISKFFGKSF